MIPRPGRIRRRLLSSLEPLEARIAPAATVSVSGGNLSVIDGNASSGDSVFISLNTTTGAFHFFDPSGIGHSGLNVNQIDANNIEVLTSVVTGGFSVSLGSGPGTNLVTFQSGLPTFKGLSVNSPQVADLPTLSVASSGIQVTSFSSDISISGAISFQGTSSFTAAGAAFNVSLSGSLSANGAVAADLTIHAANNIAILTGGSIADTIPGTNVTLTADTDGNNSGAILGSAGGGSGLVSAISLHAAAAQGILLDMSATSIDATNSGTGGIALTEATAVNIGTLDAGTGTIGFMGGTFNFVSGSSISTSSLIDVHGGTLAMGSNSATFAGVTLTAGSITGTTGTLTSAGGFLALSGTISAHLAGSFTLTKASPGTLILSASDSYSGGTLLEAGTIQFSDPGAFSTGTITINDASTGVNTTSLLATATMNNTSIPGGTQGAFPNAITVQNFGGGTTIGTTSFTGALGSGLNFTDFHGDITFGKAVTLLGGNAENTTFSGNLSGAVGTLTVTAGGALIALTGANTFSGNIAVQFAETVLQGHGSAIPSGSSVDLAANTTLFIDGDTSIDALTGTGTVQAAGVTAVLTVGSGGGGGTFSGTLTDGNGASVLGFTKVGIGSETLAGIGTYSGPTVVSAGKLVVGSDTSTSEGSDLTVLAGATFDTTSFDSTGNTITLLGGTITGGKGSLDAITGFDFHSGTVSAKLDGFCDVVISGPGTVALLNHSSPFVGHVVFNGGILQAGSDAVFGDKTNSLIFNGGTLQNTSTFTSVRDVNLQGVGTFDVTGTLKLAGTISGPGSIVKTGTGNLVFGVGYTGDTSISSGTVKVGTSNVKIVGSGSADITVGSDGMGGSLIQSVNLSNTDATTNFVINGPTGAGKTITVEKIISTDPTAEIGSISVSRSVILGDGVNDNDPDVAIAGKVDSMKFSDVNGYTIFRLGSGLPYNVVGDDTTPDSYNNHPNLTIRNILGEGVIIDVTGDGTPAGVGGGGLGKVVINSWPGSGIVRTTQSIGSFKLSHGDCNVVFEVDKFHNGAFTIASIGNMTIANGAWGSTGSEIEGTIGSFSVNAFLEGASISAGNIAKFVVRKGVYAGTTTLTDPDASGMKAFTVVGDFEGGVQSQSSIINVRVKGDFTGEIQAPSIGSITAFSFDGTTTGDALGDPNRADIVATNGSLGTITTTAGGIRNYEISVLSTFKGFKIKDSGIIDNVTGIDNVSVEAGDIVNIVVSLKAGLNDIAIQDSVFETDPSGLGSIKTISSSHSIVNSIFSAATSIGAVTIGTVDLSATLTGSKLLAGAWLGGDGELGGTNADSFYRAGSIKSVTVKGIVSSSTIEAGVRPGADDLFGTEDDSAASGSAVSPYAIGALTFGAGSGIFTGSPGMDHDDAIEAATIKTLKIGTNAVIKSFGSAHYLEMGGSESATDILIQRI